MCCAACSWDFWHDRLSSAYHAFVGTCFHLSNQGNIHAAVKLAAVIGVFFTLCGLLQLMFGKAPEGASPDGVLYGILCEWSRRRAGRRSIIRPFELPFWDGPEHIWYWWCSLSSVWYVLRENPLYPLYSREVTGPISMQGRIWTAGENSMLREQKKDVFLGGAACTRCESGGDCSRGKRGSGQRNFYKEEGLAEDAFEREFGADPVRKGEPAENEASPADEFRGRISFLETMTQQALWEL